MNAQDLAESLTVKKGDFITVVRWTSHLDNSYKGDCMEVLVVDMPFIRVRIHDDDLFPEGVTLNLDQLEIMPLSDEFVKSVLESKAKNKEPA
jgi:hypothetical protein